MPLGQRRRLKPVAFHCPLLVVLRAASHHRPPHVHVEIDNKSLLPIVHVYCPHNSPSSRLRCARLCNTPQPDVRFGVASLHCMGYLTETNYTSRLVKIGGTWNLLFRMGRAVPAVCVGSHQRRGDPQQIPSHSIRAAPTPEMFDFFAMFNTTIVRQGRLMWVSNTTV